MRQTLTIIAAFVCVFAVAQKKPNITKAKAALDKGEFTEAKAIIDQAIEYEKTKDKAKTWYYRGMIYAAIDTSTNDPEAMKTALASYDKALELDPEQKTINEFVGTSVRNVDSQKNDYYGFYYNKAIAEYGNDNFNGAADNFEKAFFINPSDSNAILNAAYAASGAEDNERAMTNYKKALEAGITDVNIYLRLYNYSVQQENFDEAYKVLEDARVIHPDNIDLMKYQINILIQQDKVDEARTGIQEAIVKEPDNPDLHFSLGVIHEESGELEKAIDSYKRAIEIDNNHYNANFNLGVMVFNECNVLLKERNALGYRETKKFDELSAQINEKLNNALPYWEKLYSLKDDEATILETLKYIYVNLKMMDKAEEVANKLDAIKG